MKNPRAFFWAFGFSSPLIFSPLLSTAAPVENFLNLSFNASAQESDNARRSHDNFLSEHQDIYGGAIDAHYSGDWAQFNSGYQLLRSHYAENSQTDYTQVEGSSRLSLGNAITPVGVLLSQSRHSTLTAPDAIDLSNNRDTRSISSAQPWVKWRLDDVDDLRVLANYTQVDFQKDQTRNLTSQGGSLQWLHKISKTDEFSVSAQSTENLYEQSSAFDYRQKSLTLDYDVHLSHLNYSLSAGESVSTFENQSLEVRSPTYKLNANYQNVTSLFGLYLGSSVTNSSTGDGNRESFSGGTNLDVTESSKDLIKLNEAEIFWSTQFPCALCRLQLSYSLVKNDYQTLPDDETQTRYAINFSYQMSRSLNFQVGVNHRKHNFIDTSAHVDFSENQPEMSLSYRFTKNMTFRLYQRKQSRDSDVIQQNYSETISGINLVAQF